MKNLLQEPSPSESNTSGITSSSTASSLASIGSYVSSNIVRRALDRRLTSGTSVGSGGLRGGGIRKLGSREVSTVAMVCSMYYSAITTLSQLKMDILTGKFYIYLLLIYYFYFYFFLFTYCNIYMLLR